MFGVRITSREVWSFWLVAIGTTAIVAQVELVVIKNQHVDIEYSISHSNHCQRDIHRIQLYRGNTIADCVTECALRPHCEALSYHMPMALCQLFIQHDETDFTTNGCDHIVRSHIRVHMTPCSNSGSCAQNSTCDVNTRTCVIKECVESPIVESGVMLGNKREVGQRAILKCDADFIEMNRQTHATCTSAGVWLPSLECIPVVCTESGVCYKQYKGKDIPEYDMSYGRYNTFDECSQSCETKHSTEYKSIQYWDGKCYCKIISDAQEIVDIQDIVPLACLYIKMEPNM